jgi:hypothetical protein
MEKQSEVLKDFDNLSFEDNYYDKEGNLPNYIIKQYYGYRV